MPGQLVSLSESPNILLDKPILVLGRHPECDVQLNSRKISRRHCCIAQVSDSLLVRDLGSTNGIRINGSRVLEGRLKNGDELTVGNFRFTLHLDDPILQPAGPPPLPASPRPELKNPPPAKAMAPVGAAPSLRGAPSPRPSSLPRLEENDPLEDAEEPVELEEDSKIAPAKPMRAPVAPPPPPVLPSVGKGSTSATDSASLFPDHLTLRPPSGPFPKPPEGGLR